MGDRVIKCPKCETIMEMGFLLDHEGHNAASQPAWVRGTPERSFWTGIKMDGKEKLPVLTYRCPKCGYLESYALSAE
jgi:phage FluMu protein Com